VGDPHDAEDAVQDALLSAYKHLDQFKRTAKMTTWLTSIVTNSALSQLRRRPRHPHICDKRTTSAPIGARNVEQLDNSLDALKQLQFTDEELSEIDLYAREGSIDLWRGAREGVA
jgi:L-glyceraldehyde 3-phosphate reductase